MNDPAIRSFAIDVVGGLHARSKADYVRAIGVVLRGRMTMVSEPDELLISPRVMVAELNARGSAYGDCDDASVLAASLLAQLGIPCRFKAVYPSSDGSFQHVFVEYDVGVGWRPLDLTIRHAPVYPPDFITMEV